MVTVIYDGDCPLCRYYVTRLRVQEAAGPLKRFPAFTNSTAAAFVFVTGWETGTVAAGPTGAALCAGGEDSAMGLAATSPVAAVGCGVAEGDSATAARPD